MSRLMQTISTYQLISNNIRYASLSASPTIATAPNGVSYVQYGHFLVTRSVQGDHWIHNSKTKVASRWD